MSDITRSDVAHLARLARLAVTDDEEGRFRVPRILGEEL